MVNPMAVARLILKMKSGDAFSLFFVPSGGEGLVKDRYLSTLLGFYGKLHELRFLDHVMLGGGLLFFHLCVLQQMHAHLRRQMYSQRI